MYVEPVVYFCIIVMKRDDSLSMIWWETYAAFFKRDYGKRHKSPDVVKGGQNKPPFFIKEGWFVFGV